MNDVTQATIELESAMQRLKQEQETFDIRKKQSQNWSRLRLSMGYTAVFLLPAIAIICGFVILNPENFGGATLTAATATLFGDVVGLLVAIWKIVISPESGSQLEPVTQSSLPAAKETVPTQRPALEAHNQPLQADTGLQQPKPVEGRRQS